MKMISLLFLINKFAILRGTDCLFEKWFIVVVKNMDFVNYIYFIYSTFIFVVKHWLEKKWANGLTTSKITFPSEDTVILAKSVFN